MKTRLTHMTCPIGALSLLLVWHSVCGSAVTAQSTLAPRSNQRSSTIVMSDLSQPKMILGVMGAVKTPGVYQFPGDQVTVKQLLEQAGQTTESATGSIRIVRGSFVNMKLFLPSQENFTLKPSDLLIVESKAPTTQKIIDLSKLRSNEKDNASSGNVQIGLVNLLDYPMLVTLKPGDSSLKTIFIDLLKQSPEIVQSTQLIEAVARPRNEPITPDYRLTDGAVLVFNPRSVDRNSLPEFPKPFEVKLASHSEPQADVMGSLESAELMAPSLHAEQQSPHSVEPIRPDMMSAYAAPATNNPQLLVRPGDLVDMSIPPLEPVQEQAPNQFHESAFMRSASMANGQPLDRQRPAPEVQITPSITSQTHGPQPFVRNQDQASQQTGQMTPQMQAMMAQYSSQYGHQLSPDQMQALQMASMQMHGSPMVRTQSQPNTPIDLTAQIEQQQRSADPSSWNLPMPDPVSSPEVDSAGYVQSAPVDNRVAQFDPYDEVRSDFPRRQFLQNLPEQESAYAPAKPAIVSDRHETADAKMAQQLVPLPTDDPFDMHKEAFVAQQYRWFGLGVGGLTLICATTGFLWMKFGRRIARARFVERHQEMESTLHLHEPALANVKTSSYQPVQKMPLTTYDQLQALIENQMPVVEETVAITTGQTLYGEPNVSKLFRYDESHVDPATGAPTLSGPHFKVKAGNRAPQNASGQESSLNQAPISAPHFTQRPKMPAENTPASESAQIPVIPQSLPAEPVASSETTAEPKMFRFDEAEVPIAQQATEKPHHFEISAQELLERTRAYIKREQQQ